MINDKVFITADALSEILRVSIARGRLETAGLLVGTVKDDEIIIHGSETGKQSATSVHVEISEEALIQAVIRVSEGGEDQSIVGWWHTHPGLTTFMSPTDVNTQKRYQQFFDRAVAIVIDPVKYGETHDLRDLDIKTFRIDENEKPYEIPLEVMASIDDVMRLLTFEVNTPSTRAIDGDANQSSQGSMESTTPVHIELPEHKEIEEAYYNLSSLKHEVPESVILPLESWLGILKLMKRSEKTVVHVNPRIEKDLKEIGRELRSLHETLNFVAEERYKKTATQFSLIGIFVMIMLIIMIMY